MLSSVCTCSRRGLLKMAGKRKSVNADSFPRKKRKVGKEKRPPENATNASFTTGKVVISTQLSLPDAGEVVTKRKQTIPVSNLPHVMSVGTGLCVL